MKTNLFVQFDGGFNLCGIDENGSPMTTQIWEGGIEAAVKKITEWIERNCGFFKNEPPYVVFFVRPHDKSKPILQFTSRWIRDLASSAK
jgi:hypothetical protein